MIPKGTILQSSTGTAKEAEVAKHNRLIWRDSTTSPVLTNKRVEENFSLLAGSSKADRLVSNQHQAHRGSNQTKVEVASPSIEKNCSSEYFEEFNPSHRYIEKDTKNGSAPDKYC
jgi:hypothetical protein